MDVDEHLLAPRIHDTSETTYEPMFEEVTRCITPDRVPVLVPEAIQRVDYMQGKEEISMSKLLPAEGNKEWSYDAVEELLLEADLLVRLMMEIDENDEVIFETDPEDEYEDDDDDGSLA